MKNVSKYQVLPLLFGSGLCALVYQTVWIRELRLVFGASTLAISAVMAIFLGGIGFGSIYLGRYAEKHRLPLKLYGQLEIAIALTAAASPLLITAVRFIYIAAGGSLAMGDFFSTIFRLALSIMVIGIPTFLMGGTLPAMARAFETESDRNRNRLGQLYGINTIGAVCGVILATFFLLEMIGTVSTLWSACLLNLLVGFAALLISKKSETLLTDTDAEAFPDTHPETTPQTTATAINRDKSILLGVAALAGFIFLVMELVWYRMLTPLLGGTTYSFGLILAIALLGIGLGSWLYGSRQVKEITIRDIAFICGLEAFFIVLPFAVGDNIAIWAILLQFFAVYGFGGNVFGWTIIISVVVLPAAIVSGYLFPLLVGLIGKGRKQVAVQTGQVYAWNTLGVIIGSLAGGFLLIPTLSAPGTWKLMVLITIILSVILTGISLLKNKALKPGHIMSLLLCSLAAAMLTATGPTAVWRHSAIGVGKSDLPVYQGLQSFNALRAWENDKRNFLLSELDGKESSVGLTIRDGLAFVINGKADGNASLDAATQVMAPLVGAILHPKPNKAMVIGVGSGSSAGWLGSIPSMERVDQIEIEPAILEVARLSAPVNNNVMENPKVNTIIGDGREILLASKEKYDLIFSEPSNPYRAGIASLFTKEFYQAAVKRLQPGGMFSQWVQGYDIDGPTLRMIYATLYSVFPSVEIWVSNPADLLFVCSMQETAYSLPMIRNKINEEPYRSALLKTWGVVDAEGFFAHYVAQPGLAPVLLSEDIKNNRINTDDRMFIEFSLAKSAFLKKKQDVPNILRKTAWEKKLHRPQLLDGDLNIEQSYENFMIMDAFFKKIVEVSPYQPPDLQNRVRAYIAFNDLSRLSASTIIDSWNNQNRRPQYPLEIAMLAESLAEKGDRDSLALAEQLKSFFPIDASAIMARFYLRTAQTDLAFQHLENSLVDFRSDPWVINQIIYRALNLALEFADRHPEYAQKLFNLLTEPFSVWILEKTRRNILVEMSTRLGNQACIDALTQLEPHIVPWDKSLLEYRLNCYKQANHPLVKKAEEELQQYISNASRFNQDI